MTLGDAMMVIAKEHERANAEQLAMIIADNLIESGEDYIDKWYALESKEQERYMRAALAVNRYMEAVYYLEKR